MKIEKTALILFPICQNPSLPYYEVPLIHPPISWHGIKVAHLKDIVAEKFKALSQRGSKKDFIDLYAVLKMKYSVAEVCKIFKQRCPDCCYRNICEKAI